MLLAGGEIADGLLGAAGAAGAAETESLEAAARRYANYEFGPGDYEAFLNKFADARLPGEEPIGKPNLVNENGIGYTGDENYSAPGNQTETKFFKASSKKEYISDSFDENGNLRPNVHYESGEFDYVYETDGNGRLQKFETDELKLTERDARLPYDRNTPGKLPNDHAGYLAGDRFGGSPKLDNLVSQSSKVNQSLYKKIEDQWAKAIKEGKRVQVKVNIKYEGDSLRPSGFEIEYLIDGNRFTGVLLN